jgi:hypothetical protein
MVMHHKFTPSTLCESPSYSGNNVKSNLHDQLMANKITLPAFWSINNATIIHTH